LALATQVSQAQDLIDGALHEGARLLDLSATPGRNGDARVCTPAVLLDARPEMAVCREASFAPLLAVLAFDTLDEALAINEQCRYGLGASIFTRTPARAVELAARLRTGAVTINDVIAPTAHPATPFGGRGASGWG